MDAGREQAVLITGVYGSGKSSVVQEMAFLLSRQGAPYAIVDLDFLGWGDAQRADRQVWPDVMLKNLAAVVRNYLEVGIRYFLLAGAIRGQEELQALQVQLPMPLRVVRLTVGLDVIEARLAPDPTAGRRDDLRGAAAWIADAVGVGLEDWAVANDRPIREVATDILAWLGWPAAPAR